MPSYAKFLKDILSNKKNLENNEIVILTSECSSIIQNNTPLKYYVVPSQEEPQNNIVAPATNQNDFELKPSLLLVVQQNQFSGSPIENPNLHLSMFVQYTNIVKANGVSPEVIRLRLLPFSLRDRARAGDALMDKPCDEAYELIKNMDQNHL
ncbi:uncharacterized protein LOC127122876 [Lathyrus oleraceus]|uniref:uncharacterized protein LOC127122876 n=1 Tax=Pisum sativum TaxID=3888 RepID=UPI0021CED7DE|nr:uncharacterized protein LOC127122876 [Pisum sativum]